MGRGRAKGKKLSVTNQDDAASGEEEKIPAQKRRGRPQKPLKDELEDDEAQKIEDEDSEDTNGVTNKDKTVTHNGKRQKTNGLVKEKVEENGNGTTKSSIEESKESNGFRHSRSRRKNKPHRAAEALRYTDALTSDYHIRSFNRTNFPRGFVFGAASSAYQIEGAASKDGKGPSIWDTFTLNHPEKIKDHTSGNIATDSYHHYKEEINIMKNMGLDAYRFSISWPRLLPSIEPYVTLFHWDLPQVLEDEYGGFLSPQIVNDFCNYAELCFRRFGDRVKHWISFNEPYTFITCGYVTGEFAPGRCSSWQNLNCTGGDSGVEPYLVAHHQLLAHAAVVKIYKEKYQESQKGKMGITLVARWMVPYSKESIHRGAARRALDFSFGWYMDPLTKGDYPDSMKSRAKGRIPKFSKEESEIVKGSFDFLAERDGVPIGPKGASNWLYVYPKGIRDVLLYVKKTYKNPTIYITENGIDETNNSTLSLQEALIDNMRIEYYFNHLSFVQKAIKKGVDVKGFFAWALTDNFEWSSGYSLRFGLNYVDYEDGLKRYPKLSARWFRQFLQH
ncbi:hypothetical protein BUALT_Bualt02G0190100 [Buddleja alternifolia]|uniref:Beta-glucosidase n=1 Tax=Buddleja alternifolia TaxID=168488 RepID=A0AAV6Y1G0_9LAMI|nr:hypothetical protein BUALT_Bualt02G0190100 [Buddleja alternifolia]